MPLLSIDPEDFHKLSEYFKTKMQGPPDPTALQEILVFNIIYYMGRRGCKNLQKMTKQHFSTGVDNDGKRYIYQNIKEHDKNHRENDLTANSDGQIYETAGKSKNLYFFYNTLNFQSIQKQTLWTHNSKFLLLLDSVICPVDIFNLYTSKLDPTLWQMWTRIGMIMLLEENTH